MKISCQARGTALPGEPEFLRLPFKPVGFVSAAESKVLLSELDTIPWIAIDGRNGGSTLVVAAIHAYRLAIVDVT